MENGCRTDRMTVEKTFILYQDPEFFSAFPGVAALGGGRLVAAFRRAPNYQGLPGVPKGFGSHGDAMSQLVICRSDDNGETWSAPRLLYSSPIGGSQDANLFYDGKFLFANSFVWRYLPELPGAYCAAEGREFIHHYLTYMVPYGTYVMRSDDRGQSWGDAVFPEPLPGGLEVLPGQPRRLHNRGNLIRTREGRLLLAGQALRFAPEFQSSVALYESCDDGASFHFFRTAIDDRGIGVFEEPCLYITPKNRFVVFARCHRTVDGTRFRRATCVYARSFDEGKTWSEPVDAGFHAEPMAACRMEDDRVLLAYGYRKPDGCGVRARICDAELANIETAEEFTIRDDNGSIDCGYPNIAPLGGGRYLVVYYMNRPADTGAAAIYATILGPAAE